MSSRRNAQSWPYPRHEAFEKQLRKSNAEWFSIRGYPVNPRSPYILERWEDWPHNIIVPEVAQYIEAEQGRRRKTNERFPLHKYIHHGLSSQAMLFNLVGPLLVQKDISPLQHAFEQSGIGWPAGEAVLKFEVENRNLFNEDSGQPTSIDLVIYGKDNVHSLFIESKLVEREFGGCSVFEDGDCDGRNPSNHPEACYLHHLGRRYWTLMAKYGFLSGPAGSSPICPFAMYYQFFRELLFAIEAGGDFVLLYDQRNPTFYCKSASSQRGLMPFLSTFVPEPLLGRIHSITIQQVVAAYLKNGDSDWLREFQRKYNLTSVRDEAGRQARAS